MGTNTSQQIKAMELWQKQTTEYMQREVRRIVDNAVIAADHGDTYPLEMLGRIASLEMANGVTRYQKELQDALSKAQKVSNGEQGSD